MATSPRSSPRSKTARGIRTIATGGSLGLLFHIRAPHARGLLGEVGLMNNEAGIEYQLGHGLSRTQIHERLHRRLRLEVYVLHAGRVEVAVLEHRIRGCVVVEATEDDMARLA